MANPTKTSCLLGSAMPDICWGGEPDLVIMTLVRLLGRCYSVSCTVLCYLTLHLSRPRHASMKNSLGLPSSVLTSHTSVTRHSMFHTLLPSPHWMKLSAVPWLLLRQLIIDHKQQMSHLIIKSRKQFESVCLLSSVNLRFRSFISLPVMSV